MKCENCYYWSELIAQVENGVLTAMCENDESPKFQKYTDRSNGCDKWKKDEIPE